MARVMKQKGIDWIFDLAEYIKKNGLQEKFLITFLALKIMKTNSILKVMWQSMDL